MLNEYAPAWCLLIAALALPLVRAAPDRLSWARSWSPAVFAAAVLIAGWGSALFWLAPARLLSYRAQVSRERVLVSGGGEGDLVFVHGSWAARLAMQLAGWGMRLDSVELVMRQNSTCRVQRWLDRGRGDSMLSAGGAPDLDRQLFTVDIAPGSRIRLQQAEPWPPECARQAAADQGGVIEVASLLWQGDLPDLDSHRPMYVRDLGPKANARLIASLGRQPYMLTTRAGAAAIVPYAGAMDSIWGREQAGIPGLISAASPSNGAQHP